MLLAVYSFTAKFTKFAAFLLPYFGWGFVENTLGQIKTCPNAKIIIKRAVTNCLVPYLCYANYAGIGLVEVKIGYGNLFV